MSGFGLLAAAFSLLFVVAANSVASACSVPVFRYALERWPAAPYQVLVFHRGPWSDEERVLVADLKKLGIEGDNKLNVSVREVDLADEKQLKPEMKAIFDQQKEPRLPWVVVRFPPNPQDTGDVWFGPLDKATKALAETPARKEIVSRLSHGQSAVWLLLASGDQAQDDAAEAKMAAELPVLQKAAKMPEQDPNDPDLLLSLPLRIEFSVLRVSRDDPAEALLVSTLLHSESDLAGLAGPMVFPIFGRGRALPGLVGKGINTSNLEHCAEFMTGACACEIKDASPGFDLPLPAEWDALLDRHLVRERRPELRGLAHFLPAEDKKNAGAPAVSTSTPAETRGTASETVTNSGSTDSPQKSTKQVTEVHYRKGETEDTPANVRADVAPAPNSTLLRNVLVVVIGGFVLVTALTVLFFRR